MSFRQRQSVQYPLYHLLNNQEYRQDYQFVHHQIALRSKVRSYLYHLIDNLWLNWYHSYPNSEEPVFVRPGDSLIPLLLALLQPTPFNFVPCLPPFNHTGHFYLDYFGLCYLWAMDLQFLILDVTPFHLFRFLLGPLEDHRLRWCSLQICSEHQNYSLHHH